MLRVRPGKNSRIDSQAEIPQVRVITLVYIASYNVRDEILLLVEYIFRGVNMCAPYAADYSV